MFLGSAIKCYDCNSHNDTRCAQDIPPEEMSITCQHPKTICRKVTQEIEYSLDGQSKRASTAEQSLYVWLTDLDRI